MNLRVKNSTSRKRKKEARIDASIKVSIDKLNKTNYHMNATKYVMIIPTKSIASSTGFNFPVEILRKKGLNKMKDNFSKFFKEFATYDLAMLTKCQIDKNLKLHQLTVEDFLSNLYGNSYPENPKVHNSLPFIPEREAIM